MNIKSKFFDAKEITGGNSEKTIVIAGLAGELCYLLEGRERALLIDTLAGAGNLKAFVRELTDLPVTPVLTHGHMDHAGGAFDFASTEIYIHPADIAMVYENKVQERIGFVESTRVREDDFTPPVPLKTIPVYDGHIFDLGGRKIKTIEVPGHTRGTLVFLDKGIRTVFSGDACNANTLLFLPHAASIEEYKQGLLHFKTFQSDFDIMYGGHGLFSVPKVIIDEAIELCDDIMEGKDDHIPSEFLGRPCCYAKKTKEPFRREDGKIANIAYNKETVFKK
ncbi:MAG: MBL fold metallo-hydrolase [Treponema sp.]|jgi:glyoxylase-like metal-dependent hydrolase (beta-lactamase superfamily II)|nr:MBL fold metallo-hydrolase [Treponema sp.]